MSDEPGINAPTSSPASPESGPAQGTQRAWKRHQRLISASLLYGTILVSAFLLFQVQPLVAKLLLPWFGGSASVWGTCMLFFQVALLAGYAYAHLLTRLPAGMQCIIHVGLVLLSVVVLSLPPSDDWIPAGSHDPTLRLLLILLVSIGLPYTVLSATSPLLQSWWVRLFPDASPYRLFALSNAGSLGALVSFPFVFEPLAGAREIALWWTGGFYVVAAALGASAIATWRLGAPSLRVDSGKGAADTTGARQVAVWLCLALVPSAAVVAVTQHITQNIAPIPFLWVLPLTLYLLSFILTFDGDHWYRRRYVIPATLVLTVVMAVLLLPRFENAHIGVMTAVFSAGLFAISMLCHGELAARRPAPAQLTSYYLYIAFGGALGGAFVVLLAPLWFQGPYELPLVLAAAAAICMRVTWTGASGEPPARRASARAIATAAVTAIAGVAAYDVVLTSQRSIFLDRDFYGSLRVHQVAYRGDKDVPVIFRSLSHGTITHGMQHMAPDRAHLPTTYYGVGSGVARAIFGRQAEAGEAGIKVAVIGLGTGTLATFARPQDTFRFYEISPLVGYVAKQYFGFLANADGRVEVALGDARLVMAREAPGKFDVIVIDAFSSDAIPMHLLTQEAFDLYRAHLAPGGSLVVHISNRYLELAPVILGAANHLGFVGVYAENPRSAELSMHEAIWVVLTDSAERLKKYDFGPHAKPLASKGQPRLWTDDRASLRGLMR